MAAVRCRPSSWMSLSLGREWTAEVAGCSHTSQQRFPRAPATDPQRDLELTRPARLMSTTEQSGASPSLNIDPRLHQMQDSHERSATSDEQAKATALHHLYQRQRDHQGQEYPPDVQALLKQLPANALPPVSFVRA